jgi:hypothetical protein
MTWVALAVVLAAGPTDWALPGLRVHVEASEELDPDRLRALARPEVVLWLRTRSNGLRRSTAETLRLSGSAFVQVRPPLGAPALAPFVGRVGPWVEERGLDVSRVRRWSPGRLAVDVDGPFTEELASRLRILRPVAIRWRRDGWPAREEWSRVRRFSGVELSGAGDPTDCSVVPPGTRVRVRMARRHSSDEVCGLPVRIVLAAETPLAEVQEMLLGHADADLVVDVGEDVGRAANAARLLDGLEAATPLGRSAGTR